MSVTFISNFSLVFFSSLNSQQYFDTTQLHTLVTQLDKPGIVPLVAAESNGDLVAPATQDESPHQDRLVGEDEGLLAARVLHCHLLSLQHTHI